MKSLAWRFYQRQFKFSISTTFTLQHTHFPQSGLFVLNHLLDNPVRNRSTFASFLACNDGVSIYFPRDTTRDIKLDIDTPGKAYKTHSGQVP